MDSLKNRKVTSLGVASGAVAGLVAITPPSGYVGPMAAIAIGLIAGAICSWAVGLKFRFGYDDSLDVVGVHLVGGIVGSLLVGVFADVAYNEFGADGLIAGGGLTLLGKQFVAIGATIAFAFVMTMIIVKVVDAVVGLRVTEEEEISGLDLSQHSEVGYSFTEGVGSAAPLPPQGAPAPERAAIRVTHAQSSEA
jgi:Amt family ammonium transporter